MSKNKLVKEYIEYMERERKSTETITSYCKDLNVFFDWSKNKNILKFTSDDMDLYRDFLLIKYKSEKTINRRISGIKSFYTFLLKYKYIESLPTTLLETFTIKENTPEYLTKKESKRMLDALDENKRFYLRDKCIIIFFLSLGLRNSELRDIKVTDVNLENKTIKIIGKGRKEAEYVSLTDLCMETLNEYLTYKNNEKEFKNSEFLFMNKDGNQMSARSLQLMIKNLSKKADINKDITVHSLRHTCITNFYKVTKNMKYTKLKARHQSIAMTDKYVHIVEQEEIRKASELAGI